MACSITHAQSVLGQRGLHSYGHYNQDDGSGTKMQSKESKSVLCNSGSATDLPIVSLK